MLATLALVFTVSAYFALGGSLLMILLEHKAHREGDQPLLSFLQDWSRFFLLMTVIMGLGLGMGIWFFLSVLQPYAILALFRGFFWVWAIVWVLVILQVSSALLYHSGWGVLSPRNHLALGWIFVASAWLCLFTANGVLACMQNPVKWLGVRHFVGGFFTQTFNPSLLMQAAMAFAVAGLFSLVAGSMADPPKLRSVLIRRASIFVTIGFVLLPAGMGWYAVTLPATAKALLLTPASYGGVLYYGGLILSILIFALVATGPLNQPSGCPRSFALLLFLLGLTVVFAGARIREESRMPFVIRDRLYVNGVEAGELSRLAKSGFLAKARFSSVKRVYEGPLKAGKDLFSLQCSSCHTTDGYRAIRPLVQGWSVEVLEEQLGRLEELRGPMPPFAGTAAERKALARWLASVALKKGEAE